jgi:hypothetical protein
MFWKGIKFEHNKITKLFTVNSPEYIWKSAYHTAYSIDCHIQTDQFSRIPSVELVGSLFDRDQHQATKLRGPNWGWSPTCPPPVSSHCPPFCSTQTISPIIALTWNNTRQLSKRSFWRFCAFILFVSSDKPLYKLTFWHNSSTFYLCLYTSPRFNKFVLTVHSASWIQLRSYLIEK